MSLDGRSDGKRPLGSPRRRWDNIRMELQETGMMKTGLNWLMIGSSCGIFRKR